MKRSYDLVVSTEWFRHGSCCRMLPMTRQNLLRSTSLMQKVDWTFWKYICDWDRRNFFGKSQVIAAMIVHGDTDFGTSICPGTALCRSHWKISQRDSCQAVNQAWTAMTAYICLPLLTCQMHSLHCKLSHAQSLCSQSQKFPKFWNTFWIVLINLRCDGFPGAALEAMVNEVMLKNIWILLCFWESDCNESLLSDSCFQAAIRAARRNSSTVETPRISSSDTLAALARCLAVWAILQVGLGDFDVAVSDFMQSRESTRQAAINCRWMGDIEVANRQVE